MNRILVIFAAITLIGCNSSENGDWSKADIQEFLEDVENLETLSKFEDNQAYEWVERYLSKCEAKYSSYYEASQDIEGRERLMLECNEEVSLIGSRKDDWTKADKLEFDREMEIIKRSSELGEQTMAVWIECYRSKCEAKYSSYYEASQDIEGCEKIMTECSEELFSNGSEKGNWSEADKQKTYDEMETIEELLELGDKREEWIECFLSKCEAKYSSHYAASQDIEGCDMIVLECNEEIVRE